MSDASPADNESTPISDVWRTMASKRDPQDPQAPSRGLATTIAAVLIVLYLLACIALYFGARDDQWDHRIKVFDAVGSLVGLAAGWVFGKEVHRREASTAMNHAKEMNGKADKGVQLAGAIRMALMEGGTKDGETAASPGAQTSHLQNLADLVETLFPSAQNERQPGPSAGDG
jgi:hypothetical protein